MRLSGSFKCNAAINMNFGLHFSPVTVVLVLKRLNQKYCDKVLCKVSELREGPVHPWMCMYSFCRLVPE